MLRLVIDDKIPFIREAAARLGECKFLPGAAISADDVRDADVLITRTRTQVNRALLEGSKVQLVVTATIGHDHIDKDYLAQKRDRVAQLPGVQRPQRGTIRAQQPMDCGRTGVFRRKSPHFHPKLRLRRPNF